MAPFVSVRPVLGNFAFFEQSTSSGSETRNCGPTNVLNRGEKKTQTGRCGSGVMMSFGPRNGRILHT